MRPTHEPERSLWRHSLATAASQDAIAIVARRRGWPSAFVIGSTSLAASHAGELDH